MHKRERKDKIKERQNKKKDAWEEKVKYAYTKKIKTFPSQLKKSTPF